MRKYLIVCCALISPAFADSQFVGGSAIDNVQNYSSSPFYSPDGAYNQKFPTPVYVKGPTLGAAECTLAVNSAIWTQCSYRNNCDGLQLEDIRPGVIAELTNKTDANYISACSGYVDGLFAQYQQQVSGSIQKSNFPTGGYGPANYNTYQQPSNPFTYENQVPYYKAEQDERQSQLEAMQKQNGAPLATVQPTQMPGSFSDLSYQDRMNAISKGWQDPALSTKHQVYEQVAVESDATKLQRQRDQLKSEKDKVDAEKDYLKTNSFDTLYKDKYPADQARDVTQQNLADERYQAETDAIKNGKTPANPVGSLFK